VALFRVKPLTIQPKMKPEPCHGKMVQDRIERLSILLDAIGDRDEAGMCALNQLAPTYSSASCVGVRYSPASLRGSYCTSRHSTNLKLGAISRAKSHLVFSSEPFDISAPNRLIGLICGCLLRMYCAP
jgi:hypothetical protein